MTRVIPSENVVLRVNSKEGFIYSSDRLPIIFSNVTYDDKGFLFNGNNSFINADKFNTITNILQISIEATIFLNSYGLSGFGRIIDKSQRIFFVRGDSSCLQFTQAFSTTSGAWITPANSILSGNKYHVVVTYNKSSVNNDPSIYINGVSQVLTETSTPVGSASSDINNILYIGGSNGLITFDGYIDNLKIYNKILTSQEVLDIYNQYTFQRI